MMKSWYTISVVCAFIACSQGKTNEPPSEDPVPPAPTTDAGVPETEDDDPTKDGKELPEPDRPSYKLSIDVSKLAPYATGLPQTLSLSAFDPVQREQFCAVLDYWETSGAYSDIYYESLCRIGAANWSREDSEEAGENTDAQLRDRCTKMFTDCMQEQRVPNGDCHEPFTTECKATIADFEACHREELENYKQVIAQTPKCEALTLTGPAEYPDVLISRPACKLLFEKCPELADANMLDEYK